MVICLIGQLVAQIFVMQKRVAHSFGKFYSEKEKNAHLFYTTITHNFTDDLAPKCSQLVHTIHNLTPYQAKLPNRDLLF